VVDAWLASATAKDTLDADYAPAPLPAVPSALFTGALLTHAGPAAVADAAGVVAGAARAALDRLVPAELAAEVHAWAEKFIGVSSSGQAASGQSFARAAAVALRALAAEEDRVDIAAIAPAAVVYSATTIAPAAEGAASVPTPVPVSVLTLFALLLMTGVAPAVPGEFVAVVPAPQPVQPGRCHVTAAAAATAEKEAVALVGALGGPRCCYVTVSSSLSANASATSSVQASSAVHEEGAAMTDGEESRAAHAPAPSVAAVNVASALRRAGAYDCRRELAQARGAKNALAFSARPYQVNTPYGRRVEPGTILRCSADCKEDCFARNPVLRACRHASALDGRYAVMELEGLKDLDTMLDLFDQWLPDGDY
jgi:hypothetical protein